MISDISNSIAFLFVMENVTMILSIIPLAIFLVVITITRRIKSFHFQILIFLILYLVGELIENNQIRNIIFPSIPTYIGPQIHVSASLFFTIIIILRFFSSTQKGKNITDEIK